MLGVSVGYLSRVSELCRDFAELVKLRDVRFVAHGNEQKVAAFFGLADAKDLDARTGFRQLVEIMINVFRIGKKIRRADNMAQNFVR